MSTDERGIRQREIDTGVSTPQHFQSWQKIKSMSARPSGTPPASKPVRRSKGERKKKNKPMARGYYVPRQTKPKSLSAAATRKAIRSVEKRLMPRTIGRSKPAASIAYALALPMNARPVRLAYGVSSKTTALVKTHAILDADWTRPSVDSIPMINNGSYFAALSRSPLTHIVQWDTNPSNLVSQYTAVFYASYSLNNVTNIEKIVDTNAVWLDMVYLYDINQYNSGKGHIYGDIEFPVTLENHSAFFVSTSGSHHATAFFDMYYDPLDNPPDSYVYFDRMNIVAGRWEVDVSFAVQVVDPTHDAFQDQINDTGYYAYRVTTPKLSKITFLMTVAQSSSGFSILPTTKIFDNHGNVQGTRLNATSIMLSNRAAPLYKSGDIAIAALSYGDDWREIASGSPFSKINTIPGSATFKLSDGVYGFHKPEDILDFSFVDYFSVLSPGSDTITAINNPYYPPGGWLVIGATTGLADGSYPGGDCFMTVYDHVEFRSLNQWFELEASRLTEDDLKEAIRMLSGDRMQFHENPWHFREIMNSLASKMKSALKLGPSMLKAFSHFIPGATKFSPLADAVAGLVNE